MYKIRAFGGRQRWNNQRSLFGSEFIAYIDPLRKPAFIHTHHTHNTHTQRDGEHSWKPLLPPARRAALCRFFLCHKLLYYVVKHSRAHGTHSRFNTHNIHIHTYIHRVTYRRLSMRPSRCTTHTLETSHVDNTQPPHINMHTLHVPYSARRCCTLLLLLLLPPPLSAY